VRTLVIFTVLVALIPAAVIARVYTIQICEPIPWDPAPPAKPKRAVHVDPVVTEAAPVYPELARPIEPAMARAGEELFRHEWTPHDPLANGDGLGPVYNATSCVACHFQNGIGGSGGLAENVTTFAIQLNEWRSPVTHQGILHTHSILGRPEYLNDISVKLPMIGSQSLNQLGSPAGAAEASRSPIPEDGTISQRNSIALFGAGLIDSIPDAALLAPARRAREEEEYGGGDRLRVLGRVSRVAGSRLGRFGWKAQSGRLADFVRMACASELGLDNPGHRQAVPLFDSQLKPKRNDLTDLQCNQMTMFVASLPRPEERIPADPAAAAEAASGKKLFRAMGCANCHVRRLGDVDGLYSDLRLHGMGEALAGESSYLETSETPKATEWRTPPLWGVADSAPYLHDGRAPTLAAAIKMHGGEGREAKVRFEQASASEQRQLLAFLHTLRAPRSAKPVFSREPGLSDPSVGQTSRGDAATLILLGSGFGLVLSGLAIRSHRR
jgi:CxxC motif-containing protein (DUF1111 family)